MEKARINRGMTLIEMVVAIVVVGLAIPALTGNWVDLTTRSAKSEAMADAAFYGGQLMEEITAKRFDEEFNPPWTPASQLGADNGETDAGKFDDADDFDGYTNTTPEGLERAVSVDYVSLSGTVWNQTAPASDFKRIQVKVSKPRVGVYNVTMSTIVGRY